MAKGWLWGMEDKSEQWEADLLEPADAKVFQELAARLNYLSKDCPALKLPIKECSWDMARPKRGLGHFLKKVARYLVGRKEVVWRFAGVIGRVRGNKKYEKIQIESSKIIEQMKKMNDAQAREPPP